jgi:hypothetical protein
MSYLAAVTMCRKLPHDCLFDKTVKSHGFLAKGLWKEGKISAIDFLAFSSKETT